MKRTSLQQRPIGFTLVELLVVISIVGMLVALLLPALASARQSANTARCLANQRQIGTATFSYINDCREILPPAVYNSSMQYSSTSYHWSGVLVGAGYLISPLTTKTKISGQADVLGCPDGLSDAFTTVGGTLPANSDDPNAFRPYVSAITNPIGSTAFVDTWYGVNGSTASPNGTPSPYNYFPMWQVAAANSDWNDWAKYTPIQRASQGVYLFDGCTSVNIFNSWRISSRHNNRTATNVLFFDFHAATVPFEQLPQPKAPLGNQLWTTAGLNSFNSKILWTTVQMYR